MDQIGEKYNITSTQANSKVKIMGKKGVLKLVTINLTSAQALTFYDDTNTTTPTNPIAALKASIAEGTYQYQIACNKGLVVNVPASYAGDATVSFIVQGTS